MIRGLYTATMGMKQDQNRMEVVSNNIANINTTGFKKDTAVSKTFSEVMTQVINGGENNNNGQIGNMALGVEVANTFTDFGQGSLTKTDNPLDLAITNSNNAFFAVDVPVGEGTQEMYTRDGGFTLNSAGQLTTKDGFVVKGTKGPIVLNGTQVSINADGSVVENGTVVDKLLIKDFSSTENLRKHGNNLLIDDGNTQTKNFEGQIVQGSIEASNVNSIKEMVDMISIMRSYEANQRVLRSHDETLQKATSEVGRV